MTSAEIQLDRQILTIFFRGHIENSFFLQNQIGKSGNFGVKKEGSIAVHPFFIQSSI